MRSICVYNSYAPHMLFVRFLESKNSTPFGRCISSIRAILAVKFLHPNRSVSECISSASAIGRNASRASLQLATRPKLSSRWCPSAFWSTLRPSCPKGLERPAEELHRQCGRIGRFGHPDHRSSSSWRSIYHLRWYSMDGIHTDHAHGTLTCFWTLIE